jgi:hypothetical protein
VSSVAGGAVAAEALGLIEAGVGTAKGVGGSVAGFGRRDADADRDGEVGMNCRPWVAGDHQAQTFRGRGRLVEWAFGEDDGEFLAVVAGDDVDVARAPVARGGRLCGSPRRLSGVRSDR